VHRASSSDREEGGRNLGDSRTGSGLRKVSGSTGRSLKSEGQGEIRGCKELIVKSELKGTKPKSNLMKENDERNEELSESRGRKTLKLETSVLVKKEKLTENEEESESEKL